MKNNNNISISANSAIRNFKNNTEAIRASIHSTRWLVKKAKEAILAFKDGEIIDHCEYTIGDRHYSIDVVVYLIGGFSTKPYWGLRVRDNVTGNNTSAGFFHCNSLRFSPNRGYKYAVLCAVSTMNNWKPKTNSETQTKMENTNNHQNVKEYPMGRGFELKDNLIKACAEEIMEAWWRGDCWEGTFDIADTLGGVYSARIVYCTDATLVATILDKDDAEIGYREFDIECEGAAFAFEDMCKWIDIQLDEIEHYNR